MAKKSTWTQQELDILEARRQAMFTALQAEGLVIEDENKSDESQTTKAPKPLTRPPANLAGTKGLIPVGFSEFKPHPAHGKPIRRCLAKNKHREDGQCGRFALVGVVYCKRHAGVMAPRKQTKPSHFLVHGRETREIRRARKEQNQVHRELLQLARALGMVSEGVRGPRPNKQGFVDYAAYRKRREARAAWYRRKYQLSPEQLPDLIRQLKSLGIAPSADNTPD